jgi:hypothetical protein
MNYLLIMWKEGAKSNTGGPHTCLRHLYDKKDENRDPSKIRYLDGFSKSAPRTLARTPTFIPGVMDGYTRGIIFRV